MKKWLIIGFLGVFFWFKVVRQMWYSAKVPDEKEFNTKWAEAQVIEAKINNKTATISEVKHYKDLTDTLQWACYGITSRLDVEGVCLTIATLFPASANAELLYRFLMEIAAVESALGTAIYELNRGYGYGLFQFDGIAFDDVQDRIKKRYSTQFFLICQRDINSVRYEDLRNEALVACFFARVYIKERIPLAISSDINERARQWKQYYNTVKGKGTVEKYLNASKLL